MDIIAVISGSLSTLKAIITGAINWPIFNLPELRFHAAFIMAQV